MPRHAGDPRRHPAGRVRRRHRRPAPPRVVPGGRRAPGRAGDVRGRRVRPTRTPASRSTCDEVATPRAGPRRGRTSPSWPARSTSTRCGRSIFEPLLDLRVPRPPGQGEQLGRPPRPCRTTWSAPTRRAWCCGSARRCATGSRATRSRCTATTSTTRTRAAHDDSMLGDQPAHLGLRDQLRRPGRPHGGQGQPAHAQARPPHAGRRRRSTRCATPPATACSCSPNAAQMTPGRRGAGLGRHRRHRRLRRASTCSTAAAPRSAWCPRPRRSTCSTSSASSTSSTARPPATSSGPTSNTQDETEWRRSARTSAA